jgi:hypothetical protein
MQHAWERQDMHTVFWLQNLKGRDQSKYLGENGSIILEGIFSGNRVEACGLDPSGSG